MLAKVLSSAIIGIDAYVVEVEVDISQGLPSFSTVGLPEGAVRESKERVKASIKNSGYTFPADRITVNLAPADVKKEGSAFDLPMALGILAATGLVSKNSYFDHLMLGELSLDGMIRPVKGALPTAIMAKEKNLKGIFVPLESAVEAAVVEGIPVYPVTTLNQLVETLSGLSRVEPFSVDSKEIFKLSHEVDLSDVRGQENVKRAMGIAASGGHNMILMRDYDKGIEEGQKAVELESNGADSHAYFGMGLHFADRPEEAIKILKKAIRLNPMPPGWYLHNLAIAYRNMGRYDEAIEWGKESIDREPNNSLSHVVLASCYSLAGREEEAQAEAAQVLRLNPKFSLERLEKTTPQKNPEVKHRFIDSLRRAGLK